MDVRLTQREVILARVSGRLKLSNPQGGQYAARVSVPSALGVRFPLPWSWASIDVSVGGRPFRFATTHLDPNVGPVQTAQAREFLAGPGSTALPVVWVGDFNSDADASTVTGTPPDTETYGDIVGAGFADAWPTARPDDPGYSCCEAADLLNADPTLDQRIDLVFTRGPFQILGATLTGNTPADKTSSGRWPSDHAGVVATLGLEQLPESTDKRKGGS
jgi:endonuclease/exonuclease/phosphatase family metal-dependent hydrolase